MEKEQKIKEFEDKINNLQNFIDDLCKLADSTQEADAKAVVEINCIVKSVHSDETSIINAMKLDELSIDAAISWVQTEKRVAEIVLNQLKIEE